MISIQPEMDDYIGHTTPYAKFGFCIAGACPHIGEVVTPCVYFFAFFFFTF